jgi:hypothetical protein
MTWRISVVIPTRCGYVSGEHQRKLVVRTNNHGNILCVGDEEGTLYSGEATVESAMVDVMTLKI